MFANPYTFGQGGIGFVTQPVTRQAMATRQAPPVRLPMPTRDNGSEQPMQAQPGAPATIASVNSPVGRNFGLVGSMLGAAVGIPGLGFLGDAIQTGREAEAYGNAFRGYGNVPAFSPNFWDGFKSNASFGLFGTSINDQARDYVAANAPTQAGQTNAFGGVLSGRDSQQAQEQERGGAGGGWGGWGGAGFGSDYGYG